MTLIRVFSTLAIVAGVLSLAPRADAAEDGLAIFKAANCSGCHHWDGQGGGGYGGASANLRATQLDRDQIVLTVRCGRIGTGMPRFERSAYTADNKCYGVTTDDVPSDQMPPGPSHYLRPEEIEAVVDYVVANVKGHGPPTYAECHAYFMSDSKVCDGYPHEGGNAVSVSAAPAHAKVEQAPDSNVAK